MRLPSLLALLLFVAQADEPDVEPESDATDLPAEEAQPTPAPAPAPKPSADQVLAKATTLLAEGDYLAALDEAIPAISDYPHRASSFEAVAKIAVDQLQRARDRENGIAPLPPTAWQGQQLTHDPRPINPGYPTAASNSASPVYPRRRQAPSDDPRGPILFGFDLGMPTGARVEWKAKGAVVDGVGLRVGANLLVYSSVFISPNFLTYVDFQSNGNWQFEMNGGIVLYYFTAYPSFGLAAQYDPPEPLQASLGAMVATYGMLQLDVNVGFLW